jgi:hypothetical protein
MALSAARGSRQPTAPGTVTPHVAMSWAQRLKRVFGIDIETCERCGGAVKTQTRTTMTCAAAEMRAPNMRAICIRKNSVMRSGARGYGSANRIIAEHRGL